MVKTYIEKQEKVVFAKKTYNNSEVRYAGNDVEIYSANVPKYKAVQYSNNNLIYLEKKDKVTINGKKVNPYNLESKKDITDEINNDFDKRKKARLEKINDQKIDIKNDTIY